MSNLPELDASEWKCIPSEQSIKDHVLQYCGEDYSMEPNDDATPAQPGECVRVRYQARIGGQEFPGCEGDGIDMEIGDGKWPDGFEECFVGLTPGTVATFDYMFPANADAPDVRNQPAVFTAQIVTKLTPVPPEFTDKLARGLGELTIDGLMGTMRVGLTMKAAQEADEGHRAEAVAAFVMSREFDRTKPVLPQVNKALNRIARENVLQATLLDVLTHLFIYNPGMTEREIRDFLKENSAAKRRLLQEVRLEQAASILLAECIQERQREPMQRPALPDPETERTGLWAAKETAPDLQRSPGTFW